MSVITFWGSGKEQVGKTLSVVAISTNMAIEHNKRILVISASYNNDTLKHCFWSEQAIKKNNIFRPKQGIEIDNGIEGLAKVIQSNRINPNLITDYTKVIFKDRLEILLGFDQKSSYNNEEISRIYARIVETASRYYDMVFIDLDNEINEEGANEILRNSDIVIAMASQKLLSLHTINEKAKEKDLPENKIMFLIGKYDRNSKYTTKNLCRYIGQKKELLAIPYNTLYFESAQEGNVTDLFLRLRRLNDKNDENSYFIDQVKRISNEIMKKIDADKLMK